MNGFQLLVWLAGVVLVVANYRHERPRGARPTVTQSDTHPSTIDHGE